MKKVTRIFCAICMMGMLTFVFTSCKKKQENGEMSINVAMHTLATVSDRAYITDYGIFMWHEQDFIRVYNLAAEANAIDSRTNVFTKVGGASVAKARFRGPSVGAKLPEGYRIFYPIGMVKGTSEEIEDNLENENRQTFVVADRQRFHAYETPTHHYSWVDPDAMPMAERMEKLTDNATLHHMFGVASFNLKAAQGTSLVVDSVKLKVNGFNITGEVSVKLHKVAVDDSQGAEHNLNYVWNQFFDNYHGVTPEYIANVLAPELEYLGWMPDDATLGDEIMMDCVFEHEDGETKGVTVGSGQDGTYFQFMLRPLALSQGFDLTVYVHDGDPIELNQTDFTYGAFPCNEEWGFTWGVKPGYRKIYNHGQPLN